MERPAGGTTGAAASRRTPYAAERLPRLAGNRCEQVPPAKDANDQSKLPPSTPTTTALHLARSPSLKEADSFRRLRALP